MIDEEFGRAWASQNGRTPRYNSSQWGWLIGGAASDPHRLPMALSTSMESPHGGPVWYSTEADAMDHLGMAVRAVHAAVPILKDGAP